MRIAALLLVFTGLSIGSSFAQGSLDISGLKADPKTFIFNDGKRTVNGYIYSMLEQETSCCGNDAIYLEVKYDAAGIVTSVKALTGRNDCYKKSIADIVKNVVWDASVSKASAIYFEVKPVIPCSGSPGENVYKPLSGATPVASSDPKGLSGDQNGSGNNGSEVKEPVKEPVKEEVVEVVEEPVKEPIKETEEVVEEVVEVVKEPVKTPVKEPVKSANEDEFLSETESGNTLPSARTTSTPPSTGQPKKTAATAQVPKQMDIKYTSPGDRRPEESHNQTHWNGSPGSSTEVKKAEYADGENQIAINLKQQIRKSGFCGLAQALIEVEVDPAGNIVNHRVMAANNEQVSKFMPDAISTVKFAPKPGLRRNYFAYVQFKTDIICDGMDRNNRPSLDAVPDILNTGNGAQ
jgi:hypothetical protein